MVRPLQLCCLLAGFLVVIDARQWFSSQTNQLQRTRVSCRISNVVGTCKTQQNCPAYKKLEWHRKNKARWACRGSLLCCTEGNGYTMQETPAPFVFGWQPPRPRPTAAGPPQPGQQQCGRTGFSSGYIVGGQEVRHRRDFPWMAAVQWAEGGSDNSKRAFKCGGAVINKRWVLTAAHCISKHNQMSVRVRDRDLATTTDEDFQSPAEDVGVQSKFSHPNYRKVRATGTGYSDIGLLKLEKDLVFSDVLEPLCLPTKKRSTEEFYSLSRAYIAGWGFLNYGTHHSTVMMWASLNITDHRCGNTDEHICATGKNTDGVTIDSCRGDSGGPLMHVVEKTDKASRWETIGIVSSGTGCGDPTKPGVYTRVDLFLDWIEETMTNN